MEAMSSASNKHSHSRVLPAAEGTTGFRFFQDACDFWTDASQRTVLFFDALGRRGDQYWAHAAKSAPHVLKFDCELLMDGRRLPRPTNYALARVRPPENVELDLRKRPFVIVDPRAGHGPGIGGFKSDSEIGVAFKAGHPCYFIGFLPDPEPGQTIEDIARAEAIFLERVNELHSDAEGKPAVIGNCQAGWAIMLVAAQRPELFGPLILAGAPLSYWAGVRGQNPMRYTGGLLGGSWLTALTGDMGHGRFDGAWLVNNFENLNPSNTLWTKHYNLYSKIDTEVPRYLEFEQWWGGHVLLNAEEMQFIVDKLFVGNKLAGAEIKSTDGSPIDLRNVRSPIIVFCSKGDNITPPQQALGWILDLYENVDEIRSYGQTIVYAVHETVGHLGIFVSGSVAKKEHDEFASNIDLIDVLPPGLYEAVMTPKRSEDENSELISGNYLVRFEARTLDDIRALGGTSADDERKFAAAARVSDINLGLYRTFAQPWIRYWASEPFAEWMQRLHPARLQYEIFSHANPLWRQTDALADRVRAERHVVSPENPFWQAQQKFSAWMIEWLDAYRDARDSMSEELFHAVYGSPILQILLGLGGSEDAQRPKPGNNPAHRILVSERISELRRNIAAGGAREATLRALIYIRMPEGAVDERSFNVLRRLRNETSDGMSLEAFKRMAREQFLMLLVDERRAVEAIPAMLEKELDLVGNMTAALQNVLGAVELESKAAKARLAEMESVFKGELAAKSIPAGEASGRAVSRRAIAQTSGSSTRRQM